LRYRDITGSRAEASKLLFNCLSPRLVEDTQGFRHEKDGGSDPVRILRTHV
jgi:hypothetical protein